MQVGDYLYFQDAGEADDRRQCEIAKYQADERQVLRGFPCCPFVPVMPGDNCAKGQNDEQQTGQRVDIDEGLKGKRA